MKTDRSLSRSLSLSWLSLLWLGLPWPSAPLSAAEPISLHAGPVSMLFEPDNAFLRYVKVGPHEILRGITAPVRDQFWGTVLPAVSKVNLVEKDGEFTLTFEALCRAREIDFLWQGTIHGNARGEIEYTFDGTARSSFLRNRIGFCVLHSPSAAGRPWVIENVRGEKTKGHFPQFISPHQPAKEIREISHELAPGLWAHVRMEGDTFEMEDQRNWTDASFKTYCTPLEIPYPVKIAQGTRIRQQITVRLEGPLPPPNKATHGQERTVLTLTRNQAPLPRLGLQVSSQTAKLSDQEITRLKALHLDHLRVDLALSNDSFVAQLRDASEQAKAIGAKLHVGLRLGTEPESDLERLATEERAIHPPVAVWLVIGTNQPLYRVARPRLKALGRKALVGWAHEESNFAQFNRIRPTANMLEVSAYGITPQIHAFDNRSIMETLPIEADTVRSARQFIGASPLLITPITLRLQTVAQTPLPGELPSSVDPRQPTLFAAAWTLGSVKSLAEGGAQSATYFETVGWKGIMESASGSALPDKFPSRPGALFPVYAVLRELGEWAGGQVQRVHSSDESAVLGLVLRQGNRERWLVANLTDHPQPATIRGLGSHPEMRQLNAAALPEPLWDPTPLPLANASVKDRTLSLPPYGIVQIDDGR